MSKLGRPAKPTALKILQGNPGQRPLPRNEPKPKPLAPPMPRGLPKPAQKVWKVLVPRLERMGLITEIDGPAFAQLCIAYAFSWEAMEHIKRDGLVTVDNIGGLRKHPMLQVFRDNSAAFRHYAALFGLSPSDRSRINLPPPEEADDYFGF